MAADLGPYLSRNLSGKRRAVLSMRDYLLCSAHPYMVVPAVETAAACALRLSQQLLLHAMEGGVPSGTPRHCLFIVNEILFTSGIVGEDARPPPGWLPSLRDALRAVLPSLLHRAAAAEPGAVGLQYLARLLEEWQTRGVLAGKEAACWEALGLPRPESGAASAPLPLPPPPPFLQPPPPASLSAAGAAGAIPLLQPVPIDASLLLQVGAIASALRTSQALGTPAYTPLAAEALLAFEHPASLYNAPGHVEPGRVLVRLEDFERRLESGEFDRGAPAGAPAGAAPLTVVLSSGSQGGAQGGRRGFGAYAAGAAAKYDRFFAGGDAATLQLGQKMGLVVATNPSGAAGAGNVGGSGVGDRAGLGLGQ
jgi:hypothetical protein